MEHLEGQIGRIFFSSNTWSSFSLETEGEIIHCSGNVTGIVEEMNIAVNGEYTIHPKYGKQFKVETYEILFSSNTADIYRYLTSNIVNGIGPTLADKLIKQYGNETIDIIKEHPERLVEIKGISEKKALKIHESVINSQLFQILLSYADITPRKAVTLYEKYGTETIKVLKENPYKIIYDIRGFGFKIVDKIALSNGIKKDSPERIAAAITFILSEIGNEGHCYTTIYSLEERIKELLVGIEMKKITDVMVKEITDGNIILEENAVYGKALYDAECGVARNIVELMNSEKHPVSKQNVVDSIEEVEFDMGIEFERLQRLAVESALNNKVSVITGGPGTGKSTIIKAIVYAWLKSYKGDIDDANDYVILCAPTGKASRRMAELTGCEATTIQKFIVNKDSNICDNKLIIIDESSMIDIYLAQSIMKMAVKYDMHLVFVGDTHQLPPIGPGNFFKDLVDSPCVPTVELKMCHRQKGTIAVNSNRINEGAGYAALNFDDPSFQFIYAEKEDARDTVVKEYLKLVELYGITNVACIVPMRQTGKSHTSANDLNKIIRDIANPQENRESQFDGVYFRIGDRVMQTENDYVLNIFNGDCGVVIDIDTDENALVVEMDIGDIVTIPKNKVASLTLAYALTVHKSQGSEYKGVVVAINREHSFMLQRNLLYTAVTRAKAKVVLVGEPQAVNIATHKLPSVERMRKLKFRIGYEVARSHKS